MVVVNIVGFPYKITLRDGSSIIIPFDNMAHEVPDEIGRHKFDNVFHVLVPPKSDGYNIPREVIKPIENNIIEINIDEVVKEEIPIKKVYPPKVRPAEKPLKGIKCKVPRPDLEKRRIYMHKRKEQLNKVEPIVETNNIEIIQDIPIENNKIEITKDIPNGNV